MNNAPELRAPFYVPVDREPYMFVDCRDGQWTNIARAVFVDYVTHLASYDSNVRQLSPEEYRNALNDPLLDSRIVLVYGRPVGYVCFQNISDRVHEHNTWYISEFFVIPQYQRKGHGANILSALARHCLGHKKTSPTFVLDVIDGNKPAESFWPEAMKRIGYESVMQIKLSDIGANSEPVPKCNRFVYKVKKKGKNP